MSHDESPRGCVVRLMSVENDPPSFGVVIEYRGINTQKRHCFLYVIKALNLPEPVIATVTFENTPTLTHGHE
ncbi:hypothetical protein ACI77O_12110 [Pseudomonas tritici]|uniref:hypothetical protein n=1 Tax=Pseudomonas tritici TaxID=2745518 RepID=UPI00387B5C84